MKEGERGKERENTVKRGTIKVKEGEKDTEGFPCGVGERAFAVGY